MRVLLIVAVVLLLMALGGWIVFNRSDTSASVELKTDKIQGDTSDAIRNTRDWIGDRSEDVQRALPGSDNNARGDGSGNAPRNEEPPTEPELQPL